MKRIFTLFVSVFFISWLSQAQPSTQASGILISPVSPTSLRFDWTNGNGTGGRVVVITNATGSYTPPNGSTQAVAGTAFPSDGGGGDLDPAGSGAIAAAVYNGNAATTITVTNLVAGTTYKVQVYEYNGTAGTTSYSLLTNSTNPVSLTYYTAASSSYTAPSGVTSVKVQAWGGGGAGGAATGNTGGGGGGAGGAYASSLVSVTPSSSYTVTVAQQVAGNTTSNPGSSGQDSWFNTVGTIIAKGGPGGALVSADAGNGAGGTGTITGTIGTIKFKGGNGGTGTITGSQNAGGGGESGGPTANGNNATVSAGGTGNFDAGDGANSPSTSTDGNTGNFPGGGGSGGNALGNTDRAGGTGAEGLVIVSYSIASAPTNLDLASADDTNINTDNTTSQTTALSISGNAETGTTIQLYDGASPIGSTTVAAAGAWGPIDITLTAGSTHAITATASVGGNTSPSSTALNITVDNSAPTSAATYSDADARLRDTQAMTITVTFNENITTTPKITVVGPSGTIVNNQDMTVGGNSTIWTYNAGTTWTGNGTATVTVGTGTDLAGNAIVTTPTTNTFTVDNAAPTAAITYDDADGFVKSGQTLRITATFNENIADAPVMQVALSAPASIALVNMTKTDATHYYYDYVAGAGDGTITVSLGTGTDLVGLAITSVPTSGATFTLDNIKPAAPGTPDLDPSSDIGVSSTDDLTNDTTPTFIGSATNGSIIKIYADAVLVGTSGIISGGAYSVTTSALTAGTIAITATETDPAGNESDPSTTPLSITLDTSAPSTPSAAPTLATASDTGTSNSDGITKNNTPTFTGTATNGNIINIYANGTLVGNSGIVAGGVYSVTTSTISDAANINITAKEADQAGNESGASTATVITVDTSAPNNQNTVFAASISKIGGASVTIVSSGTSTNEVWFAPSGTSSFTAGATMTKAASGTAVAILAPATAGAYKLFVLDLAGNISTESTAILTVDNTPPTAAITYNDADGYIKTGQSLIITATFSEPILDAPIVKIAISGSNTVAAVNMTKSSTTVYTYTHTGAAGNGTATVALSIGTDAAGNVVTSAPTSGATFIVDNIAPSAVTINQAGGDPIYGNTANFTLVFTNGPIAASSIAAADFTTGGTATYTMGSPTSGDNITWNIVATVTTSGTVIPTTNTNNFIDLAGNTGGNNASTSTDGTTTVVLDPTNPTAVTPTAGSPANAKISIAKTGGAATRYMVVAKLGSAVDFSPVDGTAYTANSDYSAAADQGSGNKIVGLLATGSFPLVVSGLAPSSTYHFAIYAENNLAGASNNYATASPPVNNLTTAACSYITQSTVQATSNINSTSARINWTRDASLPPTLILLKAGATAPSSTPVDGVDYTAIDNLNIGSSGTLGDALVVLAGNGTGGAAGQQSTVTGLAQSTQYSFTLYTYNSTTFCYTAPGISGTFTTTGASAETTLAAGAASESATYTISGTSTATPGVFVFDFDVTDPGVDGSKTLLPSITIQQGGSNTVTDWTEAIAGAELNDGTNSSFTQATTTINSGSIVFSAINTGGGKLGEIVDGASPTTKTYTLKVWLKTSLLGTLPTDIEGRHLAFLVDNSSFTYGTNSSTLVASQSVNSGSATNVVDVVASQITVNQQPTTAAIATVVLPQQPIFEAKDTYGNRDLSFGNAITLNTSNGSISPSGALANFGSGLATFTSLKFNAVGSTTISVTANSITSPNSSSITVSSTATLGTASAGLSASPLTNSTIDKAVFGFSLVSNGASYNLTTVSVTTNVDASNLLTNFRLFSKATDGVGSSLGVTGTINSGSIDFSGLSAPINGSPTYFYLIADVKPYFFTASPSIQFSMTTAGFAVSLTGTTKGGSVSNTNFTFQDLTAPAIVSITNLTDPIFGETVGSRTQTVSVQFNEPMKTSVQPSISLSGANWGTQTALGGGTNGWFTTSITNDTYKATFVHTNSPETNLVATSSLTATTPAQDVASNTLSSGTSGTFVIDTDDPAVTTANAVSAQTLAGTYYIKKTSLALTLTIDFSEAINTTATPAPIIAAATSTHFTASGGAWNGAKTKYTVTMTHDGTPEVINTDHFIISGVQDTRGNIQSVNANTNNFIIDTSAPTLLSINRQTPASTPTNAGTITWRATFSEDVTGTVQFADFAVALSGVSVSTNSVTVVPATGGTQWDIAIFGVTGNGTIGLNLAGSPTITDLYANALSTASFTGQVYTIDQTAPVVASVVGTSTLKGIGATRGIVATSVDFLVTFTEVNLPLSGIDANGADFSVSTDGSVGYTTKTVTGSGNTRTVTVSGITGVGRISLGVLDDNTILDAASNSLGGPTLIDGVFSPSFTGTQYYTIVLPEPTAAVSSFQFNSNPTTTAVWVEWQDAVAPSVQATHYLVMMKDPSVGSFPTPSDGTFMADDTDFSDNILKLNIPYDAPAYGYALFDYAGMRSGVNYDFKIYSYSLSSNYSNDNVDYNTGSPSTCQASTSVASSALLGNASSAGTVSSLIDTQGEAITNLQFDIFDELTDDDNAPFKFSALTINQGTGNDITDWTQAIAGAELTDGSTSVTATGANITSTQILFTSIPSSTTGNLGFVDDGNGGKTYRLKIWLKSSLGGTLPSSIDGLNFAFVVNNSSFTLDNTSNNQSSTKLAASQSVQSGSTNNAVDVVASQLNVATQPQTQIGLGSNFPTAGRAVITATDALGNRDLNYGNSATITNTAGLTQSTGSINFGSGVLTITPFNFSTPGTTKINIAGTLTPVVTTTQTNNVTVVISSLTQIAASATFDETGNTVSSLSNTSATSTLVFDFDIKDDAGANAVTFSDNDALPTLISQLVIRPGAGNDANLATWSNAILGATLTDGTNSLNTASIAAGTITFSGINTATLGRINDGATKTYQLKIWLKNPVVSIADVIDNSDFVFSITNGADVTTGASPTSSTLQASTTNSGNGNNTVDVDASKLTFITQPAASQDYDAAITPSPVLKAQDANDNLDLDYVTMATVATTVPATYPTASATLTTLAGVITFDPAFNITSAGNGPAGGTTELTVSSGTLSDATSNTFSLNYSSNSDIIKDAGFIYSSNIPYITHQAADITNANSVILEQFTVRDGGLAANDADGTPTVLTAITLNVVNYHNLQKLALYDGATELAELDVASTISVGGDISFSGFSFAATDNSFKTLSVKASFLPTVTDNEVITFSIVSVGAQGFSSSQFLNTTPTGIQSNVTSNENRIEVVATQLDFTTPGIAASASLNSDFSVVVEGRDANANLDVDFTAGTSTITALSNTTNSTMINGPTLNTSQFTSGVYNFPSNFQYTTGNNNDVVTLTMTAGGITSSSPMITLSASLESLIALENTPAILIPYKDFQATSLNAANTSNSFEVAKFTLHDGNGVSNDSDGAATLLTDLTVTLTHPLNVRQIALYDGTNKIAGTEQTVSGATVTWNGLSISALDNGTKDFSVRASFVSTVTADNDEVQVTIASATAGNGSKFASADAGGATTGAGFNKMDVVTTKLVFTTQPPATLNYIYRDLATSPVVRAYDIFDNLDTDYNATITVSNSFDKLLPLSTTSMSMSNGVLTFLSNFQYNDDATHFPPSGGIANGKLLVSTSNLAANGFAPANGTSNNADVIYSSSTTIVAGALSEPSTVSSIINSVAAQVPVFDFKVVEDNAGASSNNDGSPTRISQIKITQATGNDIQFADWRNIISGATLTDDAGSTAVTGTINATDITFPGLNTATFGFIADNGNKTYTLKIHLRNNLAPALQDIVDNLKLAFEILDDNIQTTSLSSTFTGTEALNSGANTNAVKVITTQLAFTTQPAADILVSKDINLQLPVPIIEALDANGNRDLDYNATVTTTNASGLSMNNAPAASAITNGLLTFANNFQYTSVNSGPSADGKLTVHTTQLPASGSAPTDAVSTGVTVRVGVSGKISSGVAAPATFSSILDSNVEATHVFGFTISDDPSGTPATENDGNPLLVKDLIITQQAGSNNTITDWTQAIAGAVLTDGTNSINASAIGASSITFSSIPFASGQLGYVGDGLSQTYSLKIYLKTALGGTLADDIDGKKFGFEILAANITTNQTGTAIIGTETQASAPGNRVTVVTTQLEFTTQPAAALSSFVNIDTPYPVVQARDVNHNRDLDYVGTLGTITNVNAGGTPSPLGMQNLPAGNFVAGVLDFSIVGPTFQFTNDSGTGTVTLTVPVTAGSLNADGGVPTAATSSSFTVAASQESLIAMEITPSVLIPYKDFQAASLNNTNTTNSFELARFTIHDGNGTTNDTDGAVTQLTDLSISLTHFQNVKEIALYDGTNKISGTEQTVSAATVTWNGLSITAPDNGTKVFSVRASFVSTVTADNDEVQATITSVTNGNGSKFAHPEGGILAGAGATTGVGFNKMDVVTTQLVFTTAPPATLNYIYFNLTTQPVVKAFDINNNLDTDYNATVSVSNSFDKQLPLASASLSQANAATISMNIVNGVLTFPADFQYNDDITHFPPVGSFADGKIRVNSGVSAANGSAPADGISASAQVIYANSSVIAAGSLTEPLTISSLATIPGAEASVFDFKIKEDNNGASSNNDGSPTRITQIKITQATGNDALFANWTDIIQTATLTDGTTTVSGVNAVVGTNNITFTIDPTSLGLVADNASKTYTLAITLRDDLSAALQDVVDNKKLAFEILDDGITLTVLSSTFTGSEVINSGATSNAVEVITTALVFIDHPVSDILVSKDIFNQQSPVPAVEAQDKWGNRDLDFNATVTTTNASSLSMINAPATSAIVNGLLTFANNFQYTSVGPVGPSADGTLTVSSTQLPASGSAPTDAISTSVTVRVGVSGTISSGVAAPATFSSILDSNVEATHVFGFTINDDPSGTLATENDGNPLLITDLVITQQSGANNTITDWTEAIAGAILTDGTNSINASAISATSITFSSIPFASGQLGFVADGSQQTYSLKIYLKSALGGTLPRDIDGKKLGFEILANNITTNQTGTAIKTGQGITSGSANTVAVVATQLDFVSQLSTPTTTGSVSTYNDINNPYFVVHARDVNANLDLDYTGAVDPITNSGALTTSPVPTGNFIAGVFDFQLYDTNHPANHFQFTLDSGPSTITLTVPVSNTSLNSLGALPTAAVSLPFKVIASFESYVDSNLPVQNIDYINYAATNIDQQVSANGFQLEKLTLHDGRFGGAAPDVDGGVSTLTSLQLGVSNAQSIRSIALYDYDVINNIWTELAEQPGSNFNPQTGYGKITFPSLNVVAQDDGTKDVYVFVTFNQDSIAILDNSIIELSVLAASSGAGSKFRGDTGDPLGATGFIGGVAISSPPNSPGGTNAGSVGVANTIEVTATRLDFTTQPAASTNGFTGIDPTQPFTLPVVKAFDANTVRDLDQSNAGSVQSTTATTSLASVPFTSGISDFTGFDYTSVGNGKLTITSTNVPGATITGTSANAEVINVYAKKVTNGVLTSTGGVISLAAGSVGQVIYGIEFTPEYHTGSDPLLQSFTIAFDGIDTVSHPLTDYFTKAEIYQNTAPQFNGSNTVAGLAATIGSDSINVNFGTPQLLDKPYSYFLRVTASKTANASFQPISPVVRDTTYAYVKTRDHIKTSNGSAFSKSDLDVIGSAKGNRYTFAAVNPPALVTSDPFNGQLNVDKNGSVRLTFDVPVISYDSIITLYDKSTNALIAKMKLDYSATGTPGGVFPGRTNITAGYGSTDLKFDLPAGFSLNDNTVYYITIPPGDINALVGIGDASNNFYPGISSPGSLYFKTSNTTRPVLNKASIASLSLNGITLLTNFDQRGTAHYLVLNPATNPTPPQNNAEILNYPGSSSVVAANGSFEILLAATDQYSFISPLASLTLGQSYDIYVYAENDAKPNPISSVGPFGPTPNFQPQTGPTILPTVSTSPAQDPVGTGVIIPQITSNICSNSYQILSSPITIIERNNNDFSGTGVQTLNLSLPTGFEFDTSVDPITLIPVFGKILTVGTDFTGPASITFRGSLLQISFTNTGNGSYDAISISGLKIIANASASTSTGYLTRVGGNALPLIPDFDTTNPFATISLYTPQNATFTNDYVAAGSTIVPDNAPPIRLIPVVPSSDYGPSTFSGVGVNVDKLFASAATIGVAFPITMVHQDNNGCVSSTSISYQVYDHNQAIGGLATVYCTTDEYGQLGIPKDLQKIEDTSLGSGFYLESFKADLPQSVLIAIANTNVSPQRLDLTWRNLIRTSLISDSVANATVNSFNPPRTFYDYFFNLGVINSATQDPYSYFAKSVIVNGQTYNYGNGGSLGLVEFKGVYRSVTNQLLTIPIFQNVEIIIPAVPVIAVATPPTQINGNGIPLFCEESGDITVNGYPAVSPGSSTGSFTLFDNTGNPMPANSYKDNQNGTLTIYPKLAKNSYTEIKVVYRYKNNIAPCESITEQIIQIVPNPAASFTSVGTCEDTPVSFSDQSLIATGFSVSTYNWSFADGTNSTDVNGNNPNSSVAKNPQHTFIQPADYDVTLQVGSQNGCLSTTATSTIGIGGIPQPAFSFSGVSEMDSIAFDASLSTVARLDKTTLAYDWDYGDFTSSLNGGSAIDHSYKKQTGAGKKGRGPGSYTVTLKLTSSPYGCIDSLKQTIVVAPIGIAGSTDFETNNANWQTYPVAGSSWQYGKATADTVRFKSKKYIRKGNSSKIWVTDTTVNYIGNSRSYLYTGVYDISANTRPMVSFDRYTSMASGDGVDLEFSMDGLNIADPTKKWFRLGSFVNNVQTGADWYNFLGLPSSPGDQTRVADNQKSGDYGWSGLETGWKTSKHTLDEITNRGRVIFRFAMSSIVSTTEAGFAVDNFRIGERTRTILLENFTTTNSKDTTNLKWDNDVIRTFDPAGLGSTNVVKLSYHIGFTGDDPFNKDSPADPSARALYYNVNMVPWAIMDGVRPPSANSDPFKNWGDSYFKLQTLELGKAKFKVNLPVVPPTDGGIKIESIEVTPLIDLPSNTILHVAVVEQRIEASVLSDAQKSEIKTNETQFDYVVKKMLPNAAGTKTGALTNGQMRPFSNVFEWYPDASTLYDDKNDLAVVVFLQNEDTKEIYQSEMITGFIDPSVVTGAEDPELLQHVEVYPNPADKEIYIQLPGVANQAMEVQLVDQVGKMVHTSSIAEGTSHKSIRSQELAAGVYILQIGSGKSVVRKKVLIVHHE